VAEPVVRPALVVPSAALAALAVVVPTPDS
jgi:hypothetical protein